MSGSPVAALPAPNSVGWAHLAFDGGPWSHIPLLMEAPAMLAGRCVDRVAGSPVPGVVDDGAAPCSAAGAAPVVVVMLAADLERHDVLPGFTVRVDDVDRPGVIDDVWLTPFGMVAFTLSGRRQVTYVVSPVLLVEARRLDGGRAAGMAASSFPAAAIPMRGAGRG